MQTILVIDDDDSLRDMIGLMLEQESFRVHLSANGRDGYEKALTLQPDLILVDLRLPGMSGVEICRQLRTDKVPTPIIVLSALGDEIDKVLLLEMGADDYVVKPFGRRELIARIRALLRRSGGEAHHVLKFAGTEVNIERRVVQPLTRDVILNSVWGYNSFPHTRTVDAHIVKLRQKFEADPAAPRHFLTVHGIGYRFLP